MIHLLFSVICALIASCNLQKIEIKESIENNLTSLDSIFFINSQENITKNQISSLQAISAYDLFRLNSIIKNYNFEFNSEIKFKILDDNNPYLEYNKFLIGESQDPILIKNLLNKEENICIKIDLYNELGEFYRTGNWNIDSTLYYYKQVVSLCENHSFYNSQYFDALRWLVYLEIVNRDNDRSLFYANTFKDK